MEMLCAGSLREAALMRTSTNDEEAERNASSAKLLKT